MNKEAFVDQTGKYHCPCGASHSRGPINGAKSFRCLKCGNIYSVKGEVAFSSRKGRLC